MKESKEIPANSPSIDYFEHWKEEELVPIKPIPSIPVVLITPPQKTARPIKQGRKFKTEINPAMLSGIGRIVKDNDTGMKNIICECLVLLKPELYTYPSPVTILNTETTKSTHYFHKARKNKL